MTEERGITRSAAADPMESAKSPSFFGQAGVGPMRDRVKISRTDMAPDTRRRYSVRHRCPVGT